MTPIRLVLLNDYHVVLAGLAAMLAEHPEVEVVTLTTARDVPSTPDLILYDTFGRLGSGDEKLRQVVAENDAKVVVYSWDNYPVECALRMGAAGFIHKGLAPDELVAAIVAIHRGDVTEAGPVPAADDDRSMPTWPGRSAGLSPRESEVLGFIARGLSNEEIARRAYLSINTVKTYIRTSYRRIGVTSRSQAVIWALRNGFGSEPSSLDPSRGAVPDHQS